MSRDEYRRYCCKKAAVISDIHGNYHAFRACYEDAVLRGADFFIFLGDYVSDLADPRKTMDLVYDISSRFSTVCLRGNRERYMLEFENGSASFSIGSKSGSLLYTYRQLRPKDIEFFAGLPVYDMLELNGTVFEIAHAGKDDDRFYFDDSDERIETIFDSMVSRYYLTGHAHRQYIRERNGKMILNPGSIGVPRDHGHLAQYAMLDFEKKDFSVQLLQVSYDVKAMIHRQFESGLTDYAPNWAISVLYDAVTGEEYTMELLRRLYAYAEGDESVIRDETVWCRLASDMGMKFREEEILQQFNV